ncbi:MAG TPA: UbiA family prenyltransferase [Chitinophagales bacterium]|nr:UbiA family prenyltransferase [Chitinophagales bacterium]
MKILSERLAFLRFYTWWNYKLPPLFGIAFFFVLYTHLSFTVTLQRLAILIVCMIGTAGFGHYLNDLTDIEADRISGKPNNASGHSTARKIFTLGLLLMLGLLPWFIFYEASTLHFLVLVVFLLFVLYSVPPVRLKNRGFWGIFSDTLYAHAIPAVVVSLAITEEAQMTDKTFNLMLIIFVWQFFTGFRNIAFHQFEDFEQDRLTGTHTWAVRLGAEKMKRLCVRIIYPLELITFLLFLVALFQISIFGGVLLLAMITFRLYIYLFIYEKGYLFSWRNYFSFVNNSYEEDIPITLLICLCISNPVFVFLLILYCILFPEFFLRMQRV